MSSKLVEEEEAVQTLTNSTKKLEIDVKRFREEVETMEDRLEAPIRQTSIRFCRKVDFVLTKTFLLGTGSLT